MQTVSGTFQTALTATPKKLALVVEIYHQDAVPGADGFDPASSDFLAGFADRDGITFRTRNYTSLLPKSSISINRILEKKLSSASFTLSNLPDENGDRLAWQFHRDYGFEGLICVFRLIDWSVSSVLTDSAVQFTGRCKKPNSFKRSNEQAAIPVDQILNQTHTVIPRRKYTANDVLGRAETDPLFEGFRFSQRSGQVAFTVEEKRRFLIFFTRKKKVTKYLQYSSHSDVASETSVGVALGRVQVQGVHLGYEDLGTKIHTTTAFADGEIAGFENIRSITPGFPITIDAQKTGELGGTGSQTNDKPGWVAAGIYSRLAFIRAIATGSALDSDDPAPEIVAIILGMIIPLPDGSNNFTDSDWSDSPIYLSRWFLNSPDYFDREGAWFDDDELVEENSVCEHSLIDKSNTDTALFPSNQVDLAGVDYHNYLSTGLLTSQFFRSRLGLDPIYEIGTREVDYLFYSGIPFNSDDFLGTGTPNFTIGNAPVSYRRRYTSNVFIAEETPAIDFLFDVLFASANLYMVQKASGKLSIRVSRPVDYTFMRTASIVGADEILVRNINAFKDNLGRVLVGANLSTSEVRTVEGTRYDTSISIAVTASGGVSTSSATLTGGSATVPPSATLTVTTNTGTKTINIDGFELTYVSQLTDTTATVAGMLAAQINAHEILNKYIKAIWNADATVTVQSRIGFLELDSVLENAHSTGVADPTTAPTAASASGGTLRAGTYYISYSYETETGETLTSSIRSIAVTANKNIVLSAVTKPAGVAKINWYASIEPNGVRMHHAVRNDGESWTLSEDTLPKTDNRPEPYANLTSEEIHRIAMAFSDKAESRSALTRSNVLKGTFEYIPGSRESINQVEIKFRSASDDFELTTLTVRDKVNQAKIKKVNKLEINGAAIDNYHQARRIANQQLNLNLDGDEFSGFTSDGEALLLEEGDVICITDESTEFVNEPIRVEKLENKVSGDGYVTVSITGRKYRRWFYDDQVTEKLVRLPIVQNDPPNIPQDPPVIIQPPTPDPSDPSPPYLPPDPIEIPIDVGDFPPQTRFWRISVAETIDGGGELVDPVETVVSAKTNANRQFTRYQPVINPNPEDDANTRYIQFAPSSNEKTFGGNSNVLEVEFPGAVSGGGSSGQTQNSNLQGSWTGSSGSLTWTLGDPSGTQKIQRKLSTDPVESFADLSPAPTTGVGAYTDSTLTQSSTEKVYNYRVQQTGIPGWSNTANITVPASASAPSLAGEFNSANEDVDLTATPGSGSSGDYTFERKVAGADDSTYTVLATQASNLYSDTQVPGATARSYTYRVKRAAPSGIYSNTVTVEIPAENDEPTLDSAVWNAGTVKLDVTFTNNGGTANLVVEVAPANSGAYDQYDALTPGSGGGAVTIVRPSEDGNYDIRLYQSDTGYSNVIEDVFIPGTGV